MSSHPVLCLASPIVHLAVTAFLHANYPSFIEESAVDDMSLAAAYLSDAGKQNIQQSYHHSHMRCLMLMPDGANPGYHTPPSFVSILLLVITCACPPSPPLAAFMAGYRTGARGYQGHWGGEEDTTGASVTAACAGSVATRGLLFANAHPAPRKYVKCGAGHTE